MTAYYATENDGGMKIATVAMKGDKIVAVSLMNYISLKTVTMLKK